MEMKEYLEQKNLHFDESIIKTILFAPRKCFLLQGPAGTGKTTLATEYANFINAEVVFFQCTQNTCEDDLLYKYVPSQRSKSGIEVTLGPIPFALELSKKKKVVLILDEFDKTRASADALLLDVLQNCRVSLYLNDKKQIITAKAENLTVFLTSNDVREFSEPLLRRLVTLYLKPIPSQLVLNIMRAQFDEKIAVLLTQIYDDTIKANLRKPATIQELIEMGKMIEQDSSISLDDLLKMFVIKYEDDYQRFRMYVSNREAYILNNNNNNNNSNGKGDIAQHYVAKKEIEIEKNENKNEKEVSVNKVLDSIKVKKVEKDICNIEQVQTETEVYAKIRDNDRDAYTSVIKAICPPPTDDPTKLGKFKLVCDKENYIIADRMLKFHEAYALADRTQGEFYVEDEFIFYKDILQEIIKISNKIRYYTKDCIICEHKKSKYVFDVVETFDMFVRLKIKAYINNRDTKELDDITKFIDNYYYKIYNDRKDCFYANILTLFCRYKDTEIPEFIYDILNRIDTDLYSVNNRYTVYSFGSVDKTDIKRIIHILKTIQKQTKLKTRIACSDDSDRYFYAYYSSKNNSQKNLAGMLRVYITEKLLNEYNIKVSNLDRNAVAREDYVVLTNEQVNEIITHLEIIVGGE